MSMTSLTHRITILVDPWKTLKNTCVSLILNQGSGKLHPSMLTQIRFQRNLENSELGMKPEI